MSGIIGWHFKVLRLTGDEEIVGEFVLVADMTGNPCAFVDQERGVVAPFCAVQVAAMEDKPTEEAPAEDEPVVPARHKVSVEGEEGGWHIICACGWERTGPGKAELLDAAEDHMAAVRKR